MKLNPVWFSPDYWTARQRFRSLVNQTGGRLSVLELSCPHEGESPLSIDIGWFGSADPKRVIMHVSGTHDASSCAHQGLRINVETQIFVKWQVLRRLNRC